MRRFIYLCLTAAIGGLVTAEVYKVIDLLHSVAINSDIRCPCARTGILDFDLCPPNIEAELLKLDGHLMSSCVDETKKTVLSA